MKTTHRTARWIRKSLTQTTLLTAGCTLLLAAAHSAAQNGGYTPIKPMPGGIDPRPVITSIKETNGNSLRLEWNGLQGPYQVQLSTNLNGTNWSNAGAQTSGFSATVTKSGDKNFHRVAGGTPNYQGAGVCSDCHVERHAEWSETRHADAFQTLRKIGQQENPQCVVCHTVGAMAPGGFVSEAVTPEFINVQCENCHGPAGNHVASGDPPSVFPIKTRSPMLCGGCHNGFHHPTYDEWTSSPPLGGDRCLGHEVLERRPLERGLKHEFLRGLPFRRGAPGHAGGD